MNATCQQCDTVFRIDPAKVPPGRVRVRCSVCRAVFEIRGPDEASDEASSTGEATVPASAEQGAATSGADQEEQVAPEPPRSPVAMAEQPPSPETRTAATGPATGGAPAPPTKRPPPSFGSQDPDARARRLARALVSDMATYHPDRRNRALDQGNLKEEFREEIKKSWQEYVEQVGMQTARGTPHFRDALNDILAKGSRIF